MLIPAWGSKATLQNLWTHHSPAQSGEKYKGLTYNSPSTALSLNVFLFLRLPVLFFNYEVLLVPLT